MRIRYSFWIGLLAVLVAAYAVLLVLARPAPQHPFLDHEGPLVMAHQGGDGLWPSNTLYAFERAVELGVDVLETDVHATADNVLVLMHDDTVDRTTNGSGTIRAMTLAQLKQLDAGYDWSPDEGQTFPYRGQGITVPTLEEIMQAFPATWLNIEIKQADPPIIEPLCFMIRQYGAAEHTLVASFHPDTIRAFRQECPEVATALAEDEVRTFFILSTAFLGALYSPPAEALQVPEYSGNLHVVTPRFVQTAQARGMEVHVWTVNETADMQRLLDLGVDGIITDYPDRALGVLERQ
ncbi:MAG: glycerophosphodiester phosphodiesterase [Chloroflexota bacterium]